MHNGLILSVKISLLARWFVNASVKSIICYQNSTRYFENDWTDFDPY